MKKLLAVTTIALLSLQSFAVQAGQFGDFREKMLALRTAMVDLMVNKDARGPAQWKAADEKSAAARAALATLKAPAGKEAQFAELKTVSTAMLDTRDKELSEALKAGKDDEAKRLLSTVQKDRFVKVTALTDALDK